MVFIMPIHLLTKKATIAYFISRLPSYCEGLGSGLGLRGSFLGFSFRSLLFYPAVVIKQQIHETAVPGGT